MDFMYSASIKYKLCKLFKGKGISKMGHKATHFSQAPTRLTLYETLRAARQRFLTNLRNPVVRRNVTFLMAGKMVGLMIVLMLMKTFIATAAHAATSQAAST